MVDELSPEKVRSICDPDLIHCKTTEELVPSKEIVGQERAIRALNFGLGIKERGFNIYVAGLPGTGRTTAAKNFLEEMARKEKAPSDWCYVNDFSHRYEPRAIELPPGNGKEFQKDLRNFIENARTALPKAFESEDYANKRDATIHSIENKRKELIDKTNTEAQKDGFAIQTTRVGLVLIPVLKGKPVSDEEFAKLPSKVKEEIEQKRGLLESELRNAMKQVADMEKEASEEIQKMDHDVALYAIGHLVNNLTEKYKDFPEIAGYLRDAQNDILDNLPHFLKEADTPSQVSAPWMKEIQYRKYEINVIVDNSDTKGAPVVTEFNPTYPNLFGRVEKEAQFGALVTDFTMIRGGSLHKANGGYLILRAEELLRNPFSYEGLKRALKNQQIAIEEAEESAGFITTRSLKPKPIPLNVKVVLIGDPSLYQQLYVLDTEFNELFKVKAEFDSTMEKTEENLQKYAAFACTLCQKENLRHLDGAGLARLIEHSSRLAEDQQKLSTRFSEIADIAREANFYAARENSDFVTGNHVTKAIEEKIYRSKLIQDKIQEMIKRGILLIDTHTEHVGQVNGLSVISLGDFEFGSPSRVTASVSLGREGIVDIEREAKTGGPIHTKGVLILSGYLSQMYAQNKPLSLSARLVFEQNYGGIEGDSASSTELYAILSALSGLPIKQSIAVTGSVNQKGEVQAIGGVNEKIEGFFEVCKARDLTGNQGVMIPRSNVQNLMLKEEIVKAVEDGKFHIYSVRTIDEGIELLTGVKAGKRLEDGTFEKDTLNYKVDERLKQMAEKLREFASFLSEEKKKP